MKVTGFTFIKNAVLFDFPIQEAIQSILPLCQEVIVAVGDCTDGTRELVQAIDPLKIKMIDTVWNKDLQQGGMVLADETNKAMQAISADTDWCFYIQGDEVLHEAGAAAVLAAMQTYKDNTKVDGLLFNYKHFYGSYDYIATSSKWYKKEIRVIKNNRNIFSYRDAQGFRKGADEKLTVVQVPAFIHHYGWVKEPTTMQAKRKEGVKFWEGHKYTAAFEATDLGAFDYSEIDVLQKFAGTHPSVMQQRIHQKNWSFNYDLSYNQLPLKYRLKQLAQKLTGIEDLFEYKNYKLL